MILTNINCSENCKYQKDGNCFFENINQKKMTSHTDCAYFTPKPATDTTYSQVK